MAQNVPLATGDPAVEAFFQAVQELLSSAAVDCEVVLADAQTVRVPAGPDDAQVGLSIEGQYRFVSADLTRAHPGGAAGTYDLYATSRANDPGTGAPAGEDYSFALAIVPAGQVPAGVDIARRIRTLAWDGAAITRIDRLDLERPVSHAAAHAAGGPDPITPASIGAAAAGAAATPSPHEATHLPGGADALDLTQIHMVGTLAARPAATPALLGILYCAADVNGATIYRCNGSSWGQWAPGVTEAKPPTSHAASHLPGSTDALAWATIHGYGTLASRPVSGATNTALTYFATDSNGGTLYRSNGSGTWNAIGVGLTAAPQPHKGTHVPGGSDALDFSQVNRLGTLAARPAASATLKGVSYLATDVNGGTEYVVDSAGAAWNVSGAPAGADLAPAVASTRTLGTGAQQAMAGNDPRVAGWGGEDFMSYGVSRWGDGLPTAPGGATPTRVAIAPGPVWLKDANGLLVRNVIPAGVFIDLPAAPAVAGAGNPNHRVDTVYLTPNPTWNGAPTVGSASGPVVQSATVILYGRANWPALAAGQNRWLVVDRAQGEAQLNAAAFVDQRGWAKGRMVLDFTAGGLGPLSAAGFLVGVDGLVDRALRVTMNGQLSGAVAAGTDRAVRVRHNAGAFNENHTGYWGWIPAGAQGWVTGTADGNDVGIILVQTFQAHDGAITLQGTLALTAEAANREWVGQYGFSPNNVETSHWGAQTVGDHQADPAPTTRLQFFGDGGATPATFTGTMVLERLGATFL